MSKFERLLYTLALFLLVIAPISIVFSKATLAILRISVCEIYYFCEEVPASVSINEAVEFTKRYDSKESASFVNGILGTFVRSEKK